MNNIEYKAKRQCTGCGACSVICPVEAISYKINDEGFFQAFVDKDKCINCGKCQKVCYKFLEENEFGKELKTGVLYAAQSKNREIVKSCTSGGVAYEIAKYGIENGYHVLGTIYDYNKNMAKAIIIDNMDDIQLLKGSKYIQSNVKDAIEELLKRCQKDKNSKFIVFGTPCQIVGISKIIEINNLKNEIIKVDLFCHGVPSYLVWKKYIKELKEKYNISNIDEINFRDKKLGWHNYCMKVKSKEKTIYLNSEQSSFYKIFFDTILYNRVCFDCIVRKEKALSDIRLGDFWGKKYINNKEGVSAVVIMSEKGNNLIKKVETIKIKEESINECLNNQSTNNYKYIEVRDKHIKELKNNISLKKFLKRYRKDLPIKLKIKNRIKDIISILPTGIRMKMKEIYHNKIYK